MIDVFFFTCIVEQQQIALALTLKAISVYAPRLYTFRSETKLQLHLAVRVKYTWKFHELNKTFQNPRAKIIMTR